MRVHTRAIDQRSCRTRTHSIDPRFITLLQHTVHHLFNSTRLRVDNVELHARTHARTHATHTPTTHEQSTAQSCYSGFGRLDGVIGCKHARAHVQHAHAQHVHTRTHSHTRAHAQHAHAQRAHTRSDAHTRTTRVRTHAVCSSRRVHHHRARTHAYALPPRSLDQLQPTTPHHVGSDHPGRTVHGR